MPVPHLILPLLFPCISKSLLGRVEPPGRQPLEAGAMPCEGHSYGGMGALALKRASVWYITGSTTLGYPAHFKVERFGQIGFPGAS